jgi:site-specific recombinase XerD
MTRLAPILEAFFTDRLLTQRQVSPHTVAAYRDSFTLLLGYAFEHTGRHPAQLELGDLDAPLIAGFLQHLETDRGNTVSTRNARLAAIHSLFRYASLRAPEHAALIARVLAVPSKRQHRPLVCFLDRVEIEALLAAPDQTHWTGRRDHAVLLVLTQTGLRVSELTGLAVQDVHLNTGAHVFCHGKGRKDRATPLTSQTVAVLRSWLDERRGHGHDPLFPTRRGGPLSRDAVERLVAKHTATAANHCPSLQAKTVTPHVLRHSAAMALLHAGVDITVIALWLGHESPTSTRVYLHADLAMKEQALARTTPPGTSPGRYHAPDALLAFLSDL